MAKFRKKPVVIEAVQWTGTNYEEIKTFSGQTLITWRVPTGTLDIATLEGVMSASLRDWIIRGVSGELYPCKPSIFEQTYEPAD